ncbi:MAG: hypothetical protein ACREO3_09980 [Arenimonas sp.]
MTPTALIAAQTALMLCLLAVLATFVFRVRRAKQAQDRIVDGLDPATSPHWFRVVVSRPGPGRHRWTFLGFEARGVLVNGADEVRLLAELPSGERIDRVWRKSGLALAWEGDRGGMSKLHWLAIGSGERRMLVAADSIYNAMQSRDATADICRMIAPGFALPDSARREFALDKDPVTLAAVIVMLVAMAYAVVDGVMLDRHQLLEPGLALLGFPAILMLAVPLWALLASRKVPVRESVAVALLVVVGLSAAYLPALKRFEQAFAGAPVVHAYRLNANAVLTAVEPGPPPIDYGNHRRYWSQFKPGSVHELRLVRGPLHLWQLDGADVETRMKTWYRANPMPRR